MDLFSELTKMQQEQRQRDRDWEATQEEKIRAWRAEQEKAQLQREDRRDRITWAISAIGILVWILGIYIVIGVLSTPRPALVVNIIKGEHRP